MKARPHLPDIVSLGDQSYEVHADGKVYRRVRRGRRYVQDAVTGKGSGAMDRVTVRRVNDPEVVRRALEKAGRG